MLTHPTTQTGQPRPVCVVTQDINQTADEVVGGLRELDVPVLRFDLADFPDRVWLDATFTGRRWTGRIAAHGSEVALEDVGAVWWWHPDYPRIPAEGMTEAEADWARREATAGVSGVLSTLSCRQVNHPAATRAAQLKPDVLHRAASSGLNVPPTWVGNHPPAAGHFVHTSPHGTVCKSLVAPSITYPDGRRSFFPTTPVDAEQVRDDSLTRGAHQLQHSVVKQFEVRVTVVGTVMHAAHITAHTPAAQADWRADYDALAYDYIAIPTEVHAGLARLMDHYHLYYAACDFIVDPDGTWWLVDLNPAGQWGWLPAELPDLTIARDLARVLARGHAAADPPARASRRIGKTTP